MKHETCSIFLIALLNQKVNKRTRLLTCSKTQSFSPQKLSEALTKGIILFHCLSLKRDENLGTRILNKELEWPEWETPVK